MENRLTKEELRERSSETLARLSPHLFLFASVILLVAALHRGATFLLDGVSHNSWVSLMKLFGRLAALLGISGLSLRISQRAPRLGKMSQTVASAAVLFTLALIILVTAENIGFTLGFVPVVGLGTFLLSVGTYSLSGTAIIRTEAYPVLIGKLLLAAAVSLLAVFFGMVFLPINWIGVIIEAMLFLFYLGVGYSIRTGDGIAVGTEPASDMIP